MTQPITRILLRWLPPRWRPSVARRGLIVCIVALFIAVLQWLASLREHTLVYSLIYSYAISTSICFFFDPLRIALHRWLRTEPPHFWALTSRTSASMLASIVLGYASSVRSTWELLNLFPQRFWSFWLSWLGISFGFLFFFTIA